MIFIIVSDNKVVEDQVVSHLEARSIHPIRLGEGNPKDRLSKLDSARHYAVCSVRDVAAVEAVLPSGMYRLAVIGNSVAPSAHIRIAADDPDLMSQIERFVVAAIQMASLQCAHSSMLPSKKRQKNKLIAN